jgi:hypothetical protein
MFKIKGLDHIALRTIQLDKMRFFYCDLLRSIGMHCRTRDLAQIRAYTIKSRHCIYGSSDRRQSDR